MPYTKITADDFAELDGLDDWRVVLDAIQAEFCAESFSDGAALLARIAEAADEADHHPDLDLRYPGRVRVRLTTHAVGGLSTHDVELARRISSLAEEAGASSDPTSGQFVELAIDTMDADRIRPFWVAVLGYTEQSDGSLADPRGAGPAVWFQQMNVPRTERNRFHLDVSVPHDLAASRLEEALAAGGTLVSDSAARAFWVLADAEGNEACVCTWQDRG